MKTISIAIGNMRKPKEFVIYPRTPDATDVTIQSDDCIASVDLSNGKTRWVRNKGGAYFIHLQMFRGNAGRGETTLPDEVVNTLRG